MPNFNQLNGIFQSINKLSASLGGQLIKIGRPDYSIVNNSPVILYSSANYRYRIEKTSHQYVQEDYRDMEVYSIFGDRSKIQIGDQLIPQESTTSFSLPLITVVSNSPMYELMGISTPHLATISNGQTNLFTNVRYDTLNDFYPGAALNRELESSLGIPSKKVVIYNRALGQTSSQARDVEGLIFTEVDFQVPLRWTITQVVEHGNVLILTLKEAVIS